MSYTHNTTRQFRCVERAEPGVARTATSGATRYKNHENAVCLRNSAASFRIKPNAVLFDWEAS